MVKRRDFKEDSLIMSAIEKLTVLLASSAAIVHGFLIYDLAEQYSIYYCNSCLISHQISEVSFCSKNIVMPAAMMSLHLIYICIARCLMAMAVIKRLIWKWLKDTRTFIPTLQICS